MQRSGKQEIALHDIEESFPEIDLVDDGFRCFGDQGEKDAEQNQQEGKPQADQHDSNCRGKLQESMIKKTEDCRNGESKGDQFEDRHASGR